ncbi:MAG TPA: HEAT repeat domain-containing protein [Chloroflexia bacterium]|nr:HEAT repeat domain-containing protein [Chloroflexia bacterium]
MDFRSQLNAIIGEDNPLAAASLTFLSDISSDDRATLALMWPGIGASRRRKIAATLVQLAEDNLEYDFSTALHTLLDDPDAQVRRVAVEGLIEDESVRTVRRLITVLSDDPDPAVRAAAAYTLGPSALRAETGKLKGEWPQRLCNALLAAVRGTGQDIEVRRRALETLGYFSGSADVQAEITAAYKGPDLLRASALVAMGRSMDPQWATILLAELRSAVPMMRYEAVQAVGELGDRANVPAILPLLEDDDLEVQLAAIAALGQLGGRVSAQALRMLGDSATEVTREAIDDALTEVRHAEDPLSP